MFMTFIMTQPLIMTLATLIMTPPHDGNPHYDVFMTGRYKNLVIIKMLQILTKLRGIYQEI